MYIDLLAYFLAGSIAAGIASALALHWLWMPRHEPKPQYAQNLRRVK